MNVIPKQNLFSLIKDICSFGAQPITLLTKTNPELLKKDRVTKNPNNFGVITKLSLFNGFLNFNYENSVNLQREREDKENNFKSQSNYFEHVENLPKPLVRNKKDNSIYYLQIKLEKVVNEKFLDEFGNEIDKEELINFLPKSYEDTNQGINKEILTLVIKLDNIIAIKARNETYFIGNQIEIEDIFPKEKQKEKVEIRKAISV